MDVLSRCLRLMRGGDGYTGFARINDDSTWTVEVVETQFSGRTQHRRKHLLNNISARDALPFLEDLIDSAKTEANHGGKL